MCRCTPLQEGKATEDDLSDRVIVKDTIEVTGDIDDKGVLLAYFEGPASGGKREKLVEWIKHDDGVIKVKFSCDEGIFFLKYSTS